MIVMTGCLQLGLACQKKHEDDIRKSYLARKFQLYQEAKLFFKCAACLQDMYDDLSKTKTERNKRIEHTEVLSLNITVINDMIYAFFVNF